MTKKIGIIGGGIVGSTAAFYLKKSGHTVTLFDEPIGQATSAAAGIISPWLSQRRNKEWYYLAREGAKFYQQLIKDLDIDPQHSDIYQQTGTILYKKNQKLLEKLYDLAHTRREEAPEIGEIYYVSKEEVKHLVPMMDDSDNALFISGGAKVDGRKLIQALHQQTFTAGQNVIQETVTSIAYTDSLWTVQTTKHMDTFDELVLACGAWLPKLLEPLHYDVDIRPQKGQLIALQTEHDTSHSPVIMPVGEVDIIPFNDGTILVGATHENDMGYDLTPDTDILNHLKHLAVKHMPTLSNTSIESVRVGTRAYTSDFLPFFGTIDTLPHLYVASGLGSSGLTTGPVIGKTIADWLCETHTNFDHYLDLPNRYITPSPLGDRRDD